MRLTTKISLVLIVSFLSQLTLAQNYTVYKEKKSYLGINGAFNFSTVSITDRYSVLNSTDAEENESFEKMYGKFGLNRGSQFGVNYHYNFTDLISIVAGVGYKSLEYNYITQYSWSDTINNQDINREMHHNQRVSYFTIPIVGRFEMNRGQWKPYGQFGLFMDFRHQAKKSINFDNTLDEEDKQVSSSSEVSITDNTRKFNFGLLGGIGLNYYTKFVTIGVGTNYRYGFSKVINDATRYIDYNGFALKYLDVPDQLKLGTLTVEFSLSVPINQSVALNILRRKNY